MIWVIRPSVSTSWRAWRWRRRGRRRGLPLTDVGPFDLPYYWPVITCLPPGLGLLSPFPRSRLLSPRPCLPSPFPRTHPPLLHGLPLSQDTSPVPQSHVLLPPSVTPSPCLPPQDTPLLSPLMSCSHHHSAGLRSPPLSFRSYPATPFPGHAPLPPPASCLPLIPPCTSYPTHFLSSTVTCSPSRPTPLQSPSRSPSPLPSSLPLPTTPLF